VSHDRTICMASAATLHQVPDRQRMAGGALRAVQTVRPLILWRVIGALPCGWDRYSQSRR
jgi:hypothetical protein